MTTREEYEGERDRLRRQLVTAVPLTHVEAIGQVLMSMELAYQLGRKSALQDMQAAQEAAFTLARQTEPV